MSPGAPRVGVFDSGIGGLSVWRALRQALPGAHLHYLADTAWAPYGERDAALLRERITALIGRWQAAQALDLLVLACNSATAVAIDALRLAHPGLPIVGIEPAIRPALAATRSGEVGVLATRATLHSARFAALKAHCLAHAPVPGPRVHERAADGLADAIERGDEATARHLCHTHLNALLAAAPGIDTLVLGCTHYPLAEAFWRAAKPGLTLIDPADAVARRARSLLPETAASAPGTATWACTGDTTALARGTRAWLGVAAQVQASLT